MILTEENYFSEEADREYMSVSQYKNFKACEAKALATVNGEVDKEFKEAFEEGHLYETLLSGDVDLYFMQHPEMVSSRGATKGELKANYKTVVEAANRMKEQKFITDIIDKCDKQVILTGEISGVKIKCCLDLLDLKEHKIYDLKCMKDFNDLWDTEYNCYMPWYQARGYVLQMAVYQEIVRQNYNIVCDTHLIASSKEKTPDIVALRFGNGLLKEKLDEFSANVPYYNDIKKGLKAAHECGVCDFCKSHKTITEFKDIQ